MLQSATLQSEHCSPFDFQTVSYYHPHFSADGSVFWRSKFCMGKHRASDADAAPEVAAAKRRRGAAASASAASSASGAAQPAASNASGASQPAWMSAILKEVKELGRMPNRFKHQRTPRSAPKTLSQNGQPSTRTSSPRMSGKIYANPKKLAKPSCSEKKRQSSWEKSEASVGILSRTTFRKIPTRKRSVS